MHERQKQSQTETLRQRGRDRQTESGREGMRERTGGKEMASMI